jgi:hypothetical protein
MGRIVGNLFGRRINTVDIEFYQSFSKQPFRETCRQTISQRLHIGVVDQDVDIFTFFNKGKRLEPTQNGIAATNAIKLPEQFRQRRVPAYIATLNSLQRIFYPPDSSQEFLRPHETSNNLTVLAPAERLALLVAYVANVKRYKSNTITPSSKVNQPDRHRGGPHGAIADAASAGVFNIAQTLRASRV